MDLEKNIIAKQNVVLFGMQYQAYLKEVATKIKPGGEAVRSTKRVFIRKV